MNLIPNANFESGLDRWESTPSGVSLVRTDTKRFVMLAGQRHSAAICSDPFEVVPRAAYALEVERAVRGECELGMIGKRSLLKPDALGEVVAAESPVRVQVTAQPGHRVGVARVLLTPVGHRARILNLRSTVAFQRRGEPFQVLCEIHNTGSEPMRGALARFSTATHELVEEHRQEVRVPTVGLGESVEVGWTIAKQRPALAPFTIELEYAGGTVRVAGTTLRHVPRPADKQTLESVAGGRRWFTVGSRGLRVTAHETDMDFGPMLLTDDASRRPLGVIHHIAQIVPAEGGAIPLWSRVRAITPRGVELAGKNELADWAVTIRPDHRARGITFEASVSGKRRISNANFEFAPLQTLLPFQVEGIAALIGGGKEAVKVRWSSNSRTQFEIEASERSGLFAFRSQPTAFLPGMVFRASATLQRAASSIIPAR